MQYSSHKDKTIKTYSEFWETPLNEQNINYFEFPEEQDRR